MVKGVGGPGSSTGQPCPTYWPYQVVEPATAWLPQFCSTRVRAESPPGGTVDGLNANWATETPPVHAAAAVAAASAAPGASSPASGTNAARTDINSFRSIADAPSP